MEFKSRCHQLLFLDNIHYITIGYYGESLPYDSGLTSVIKAHGSTTNEGTTSDQMSWTEGNAILLIRNPYKAIYGHRHLDAGGHVGYADASHFFGPGNKDTTFYKKSL